MEGIVINGLWLDVLTLRFFSRRCGLQLPPGRYWYDSRSGCAGAEGEGTSALLPPGLPLGGTLSVDVSRGDSGVLVNGRELTRREVAYLAHLLDASIAPGCYWLDGQGNAGKEGGPATVNLWHLARQRGGRWVRGDGPWSQGSIAVLGPEELIGGQVA